MRNGKDEQNVEEECGIKEANRMPRKNEEWIKQPGCQGEMRNGNGKQNAKEEWKR